MQTLAHVDVHAPMLHTVGTVLGMSLFLTTLLAVLWNLPWRACERAQIDAALRGEWLDIPPRPSPAQWFVHVTARVPPLARGLRRVGV